MTGKSSVRAASKQSFQYDASRLDQVLSSAKGTINDGRLRVGQIGPVGGSSVKRCTLQVFHVFNVLKSPATSKDHA